VQAKTSRFICEAPSTENAGWSPGFSVKTDIDRAVRAYSSAKVYATASGEVAERLKAAVLETFRHVYHGPLA
jgi:hypothetical protein